MFYRPDLIPLFWLVPVVLLVMAPMALLGFWPLWRLGQFFFFLPEPVGEKRGHPRFVPYSGTVAEISDGRSSCMAVVGDISRQGIRLLGVPQSWFGRMDQARVIVHGLGQRYDLRIQPRWTEISDAGPVIGAEIFSSSTGWSRFLLQSERVVR